MMGLNICNWCDKTIWWWEEEHKLHMNCRDGDLDLTLCESCWNTFTEFNEYIEEVKRERELDDETI